MRLITGDECGLLKEIIPELCRARPTNNSDPTQQQPQTQAELTHEAVQRLEPSQDAQARDRGVVALTHVRHSNDSDNIDDDSSSLLVQFAALRLNGTVELWSAKSMNDTRSNNSHPANYAKLASLDNVLKLSSVPNLPYVRPIGMVSQPINSASSSNIAATCDSIGNIALLDTNDLTRGVIQRYNAFELQSQSVPNNDTHINIDTLPALSQLTYSKGRHTNHSLATALAMDATGTRLALGGRERALRLLDLETGKLLWKAKNLPPDPQTLLQQPTWPSAIQFLHYPPTPHSPTDLIAIGTAYQQVQIYDSRSSSRRPIHYTPKGTFDHRITSLLQLSDGHGLVVGDTVGDCHIFDWRNLPSKQETAKVGLGRLVGPGGSIRQLAMHPTLPVVACVGLDRKLWTWDVNTRKKLDCVYLKQRLNCVLFCEDGGEEEWEGQEEEDRVGEYVDSEEDENESDQDDLGERDANDEQSTSEGSMSEEEWGDEDDDSSNDDEEDGEESIDVEEDEEEEDEPVSKRRLKEFRPTKKKRKG